MNKTKIDWCHYTWNPIKGYCPNTCEYCYAHRMYERFGWDKKIRFDEKELLQINRLCRYDPLRIFVGSMIDMYHPKINRAWMTRVIYKTEWVKMHKFLTLTKYVNNMLVYDFPSWWWLGVTIDGNDSDNIEKLNILRSKEINNIKFASFEPLLSNIDVMDIRGLDWIIVGGLTPKPVHKKEWIDDIVERANQLNIPVFIKHNAHYNKIIRQFPNGKN